jgi:broad specificity phosphatase PhoE
MSGSDEVFLIYFEVGSGSAQFREKGYAGGFVTAFVPSSDLRRALDTAEAALAADGYDVVNIDKVLRYEPEEWEHDEDVNSAVAECRETGEISYSTFEVWGH